jgi:hypothetical protein
VFADIPLPGLRLLGGEQGPQNIPAMQVTTHPVTPHHFKTGWRHCVVRAGGNWTPSAGPSLPTREAFLARSTAQSTGAAKLRF